MLLFPPGYFCVISATPVSNRRTVFLTGNMMPRAADWSTIGDRAESRYPLLSRPAVSADRDRADEAQSSQSIKAN
jgi:hypothetical protein